jgi:hypothetical protein
VGGYHAGGLAKRALAVGSSAAGDEWLRPGAPSSSCPTSWRQQATGQSLQLAVSRFGTPAVVESLGLGRQASGEVGELRLNHRWQQLPSSSSGSVAVVVATGSGVAGGAPPASAARLVGVIAAQFRRSTAQPPDPC